MNPGELVMIYFGGLLRRGEDYGIIIGPDPEFELRTIVLCNGMQLSIPTFQLSAMR